MPDLAVLLLTIVTIISVGLIGGVFFIFSVTVMRALGRIPAPSAITAMQEINVVIVRSLFLAAFFGAALTSLVLAVYAMADWQSPGAPWLLAGAVIYLAGSVLLTMIRNVPLNNELAAVAPSSPEGEAVWTRYLAEWTMWNHIRTIACIVATACFTMALADNL
jgi:uncharacterized membrane protein